MAPDRCGGRFTAGLRITIRDEFRRFQGVVCAERQRVANGESMTRKGDRSNVSSNVAVPVPPADTVASN